MIQLRYHLKSDPSTSEIRELLTPLGGTRHETVPKTRVDHIDTFDWRLFRAGMRLTWERSTGREVIRIQPSEGAPTHAVPCPELPRWTADLPVENLRSTLADILDVRALLPLGSTSVERDLLVVEDGDGNTRMRLWLERISAFAADGSALPTRVMLRLEDPGDAGVFLRRARALVTENLDAGCAPLDDLDLAVAANGRSPGDYTSKIALELDPELAAAEALQEILSTLSETVCANVDGVVRDLDVEFLHDLRVATRRTRSALGQLKGILEPEAVKPFADEFRWLGTVTGPCRDLDVYLIELQQSIDMLPAGVATGLDSLTPILGDARDEAHRRVVAALRGRRFRKLTSGWERFLTQDLPQAVITDSGDRPIGQLADERIHKAYRRIVMKGRALGDDPPAAALHRLRIDAKKLRYLLEFFRGFYPESAVGPRIGTLKHLQDVLGGFQDMEVQRERLEGLATRVLASSAATATTLLAMGELASVLRARQERYRLAFADRFAPFASSRAQAEWRDLCGASPRKRTR